MGEAFGPPSGGKIMPYFEMNDKKLVGNEGYITNLKLLVKGNITHLVLNEQGPTGSIALIALDAEMLDDLINNLEKIKKEI